MARRYRGTDRKAALALKPRAERLGSRALLAPLTAVVTTTLDSPVLGGTLRDAIELVDTMGDAAAPNSIVFQIPKSDSGYNPASGTFTFHLSSQLPPITRPALIDGTTESAFLGGPALLVIDGSQIKKPGDGLTLDPSAPGSTILDLEILGFDGSGIAIHSTGNTIGGAAAGDGNILVSNTTAGVSIAPGNNGGNSAPPVGPSGASGNVLLGNFIGTDASGANLGNGAGIISSTSGNTIGGITAGAANVIGFNMSEGVLLSGANASGNVLLGNSIGTNAAGANLANPIGVSVQSPANTIGGTSTGAANVIGFNTTEGVFLGGANASGNVLLGNFIGTNAAGANLANPIGVSVQSPANTIGGTSTGAANVIAFGTSEGVLLSGAGASGNVLQGNLIGTDSTGEVALGNGIGVLASGGTGNSIGGSSAGAGNVISGNVTAGIELAGGSVSGTEILGNRIGTDPSGTHAVTRGWPGRSALGTSERGRRHHRFRGKRGRWHDAGGGEPHLGQLRRCDARHHHGASQPE